VKDWRVVPWIDVMQDNTVKMRDIEYRVVRISAHPQDIHRLSVDLHDGKQMYPGTPLLGDLVHQRVETFAPDFWREVTHTGVPSGVASDVMESLFAAQAAGVNVEVVIRKVES
jgi:hypothetical protein